MQAVWLYHVHDLMHGTTSVLWGCCGMRDPSLHACGCAYLRQAAQHSGCEARLWHWAGKLLLHFAAWNAVWHETLACAHVGYST